MGVTKRMGGSVRNEGWGVGGSGVGVGVGWGWGVGSGPKRRAGGGRGRAFSCPFPASSLCLLSPALGPLAPLTAPAPSMLS